MRTIPGIVILLLLGFNASGQSPLQDSAGLKPSTNKRMIPTEWQLRKDRSTQETRNKRADDMALRAKDSLNLSSVQVSELININRSLEQQKEQAFKTITGRNEAGTELQRIERQRDKMYQAVLTPEQFKQYIKRKSSILNKQ